MYLAWCFSELYHGLIETYFIDIIAYPIMKGPAQECVKETWGPREHFGENIKVTMVKGQEHEALGNRCEEELGMLGPVQEARTSVWEKKDRKERTASGEAALTLPLPILGPERDQGLLHVQDCKHFI